ncbi:MAG TPA: hypothetical protein DCY79_04830 [Planctomycetaceae bacterium]|nr:hypothetical protein [Planctomycetaceae bacterium]
MARIFFALACLAFLILVVNLVVGATSGDYGGSWRSYASVARTYQKAEKQAGLAPGELQKLREANDVALDNFLPVRNRMKWHFWLGIIGTLVTILLNSVSVTYFIGTNRWCMEVVETYSLDSQLAIRSKAIKREAFPWAFGGIVAMITVAAFGGLADPAGYYGQMSASWVTPHWILASLATLFVGWSFLIQVGKIGENYDVIETILLGVESIRQQRVKEREQDDLSAKAVTD